MMRTPPSLTTVAQLKPLFLDPTRIGGDAQLAVDREMLVAAFRLSVFTVTMELSRLWVATMRGMDGMGTKG